MEIGEIKELKIEKLLYEGVGLAHCEDLAVFIENVCDGDFIKAQITSLNKKFARAKMLEIIEPSKFRTTQKFCALSNVCGGCQWNYIDYNHQLDIKKQIIKEALHSVLPDNIKKIDIIPCKTATNFRYKIQLPVSQTKNSKRFLTGYFKPHTHEIVNIKHCEIQPECLDEIISFIKEKAQELDLTAYNEKTNKGLLRHIIFKVSSFNEEILLTFVVNSEKTDAKIQNLAQIIAQKFKNICGICVNFNTQKNNVILGKTTQNLVGQSFYTEKLNNKLYQISVNSFFQTNPYIAGQILETIKKEIKKDFEKPNILDAYSGVATFGIYLSDIASHITCVESEQSSCKDAQESLKLNKINNIEIINDDATKVFEEFIKNKKQFDITVIDPPRKGSTVSALENIAKMTAKTIFYVSCNPQTLARDSKILQQNGFELSFVRGADMFPHSYHIETIAKFNRH